MPIVTYNRWFRCLYSFVLYMTDHLQLFKITNAKCFLFSCHTDDEATDNAIPVLSLLGNSVPFLSLLFFIFYDMFSHYFFLMYFVVDFLRWGKLCHF